MTTSNIVSDLTLGLHDLADCLSIFDYARITLVKKFDTSKLTF